MKKKLLSALLTVSTFFSYSQDIITKRNGDEIKARILEVGTQEIKFKKFENMDGPLFVMTKGEVLFIKYENGTKDVFEDIKQTILNTTPTLPISWKLQAEDDVLKHYRGYRSSQSGTFWTTVLFSPVIGLIPAIATTRKKPSAKKYLQYPNDEYFNNLEYKEAYINKAYKRKKKKVWGMFGLGSAIWGGVTLLALAGSGG